MVLHHSQKLVLTLFSSIFGGDGGAMEEGYPFPVHLRSLLRSGEEGGDLARLSESNLFNNDKVPSLQQNKYYEERCERKPLFLGLSTYKSMHYCES